MTINADPTPSGWDRATAWCENLWRLVVPGRLGTPADDSRRIAFERQLPFVELFDRYLIDRHGFVHAMFWIDAPGADVASNSVLVDIQTALTESIRALPPEICQIQFEFARAGSERDLVKRFGEWPCAHPIAAWLRRRRAAAWMQAIDSRRLMRTSTVVILTCGPVTTGQETDWILRQFRKETPASHAPWLVRRDLRRDQFAASVQTIRTAALMLRETFRAVGMGLAPVSGSEVASYFHAVFAADLGALGIEPVFDPGASRFYDAWLCGPVRVWNDCVQIGRNFHGTVSLNKAPVQSSPRDIERITTELDLGDFRTVVQIRRTDQDRELLALERKGMQATNTALLGRDPQVWLSPGAKPDTRAPLDAWQKDKVDQADRVKIELQNREHYLVWMQVVIHFWHEDRTELRDRRAKIMGRMAHLPKAAPWEDAHQVRPVLINAMPGSYLAFQRPVRVKARMAADLVPLFRGMRGGRSPVSLFENAHAGLVALDGWDRTLGDAGIFFILGASGAGKTTLAQKLVLEHLVDNPHETAKGRVEVPLVFLFDVGGGFRSLNEVLGGKELVLSHDRPRFLNPFQMVNLSSEQGIVQEPDPPTRARLLRSLVPMVHRPERDGRRLPDDLIALLSDCLDKVFLEGAAARRAYVRLDDLLRVVARFQDRPDGAELARRLQPICDESGYGRFFNGRCDLALDAEIVYINATGLERDPTLAAMVFPLLLNWVEEAMAQFPQRRKVIAIDEFWRFVHEETVAAFLVNWIKTIRKRGGMILGSTQSVQDSLENPLIEAALRSCVSIWMLLEQRSAEDRDLITDKLALTEGESRILASLARASRQDSNSGSARLFREFLAVIGSGPQRRSGRVRNDLSGFDYWLFTDESEEVRLREETVRQWKGDRLAALDHLCRMYPAGLHAATSEL